MNWLEEFGNVINLHQKKMYFPCLQYIFNYSQEQRRAERHDMLESVSFGKYFQVG